MEKRRIINKAILKRRRVIGIAIIVLLCMSVGYSLLSQSFLMNSHIEIAKLKVTVNSGQYLQHGTKTGTDCPAGSFCPGNTFSYDSENDQGIISCVVGSYSASKSGICTACQGKTTSNIGQTSCNAECSNKVGVNTWVEAVWNSNNSMSNVCTIHTCKAGYTKSGNACVANTYHVTLNNDNATTPGSTSVTVTFDSDIPTITPPTKRGYTFKGYNYIIEHDDPTPDEEILYIKADGTSNKKWDLTSDKTLVAKWEVNTITCDDGEYLPHDATTCSACPEGYSCSGGDYPYHPTNDQGANICPSGTYSTGGTTSCSTCEGGVTSEPGATSCSTTCPNSAHVHNWVSGCTINTCDTGYEKSNNTCVARKFNITLDNKGANAAGSTTVEVTYNAPVPSITVPEKTGYTFGGYYTEDNGAGTQYIKADGTSAKNWDKTDVNKLYAKWTVISKTCSEGQYLPGGTTTCAGCLAGSFCPGGTYSYKANQDQGITQCAIGSYSGASSTTCTACTGLTTSAVGQTSCNAECSNKSNVSTWNNANWNNNNPTSICSIKTCTVGYTLNNNQCEASELDFSNQTVTSDYSSSAVTKNVTAPTTGTGTYTYTKKSGESDITVSSAGVITIPANKTAGEYTVVITASDSNSGVSKDATYTIRINKINATLTCEDKTYDGTEQTACTCSGGTIGGDYKATNAGNYTASCTGDSNHNNPSNETWTMNKKAISPVTNLSISNTGVVSWTNSDGANSYQISIDNTNWTTVPAGTNTTSYNYLNSIVGGTGNRTVYVRATTDTTNYTNSSSVNTSTTVYTVTFNVNNNDYGTVSPTTMNVITGETYTTNNNVLTLLDGRETTATATSSTVYSSSFESWSSESGTISGNTAITANFTSEIVGYNITYDANGGVFNDSTTTNNVVYSVATVSGTKYSHTSNVDDTGLKSTYYGNNWTNANITGTDRGDTSKAHVVTIPDASTLNVELYYNSEGTSWDWVSVWAGNYPNYTASSNATSTGYVTTAMGAPDNNNKFGGSQSGSYSVNGNSLTSMGHTTLTIPGDTVTFGFKSDGSGSGQGYGYYAIVTAGNPFIADTGTYKEPTKSNKVFDGWNTEANGSGIGISSEAEISKLNSAIATLYAQYREPTATFANGQAFNAAIKQASGSSSATYSTSNTNITSFEKYTGEFTELLRNNSTVVSDATSENDIYAWFDNGTVYWYTTSDTVYFNSNSSYMFNNLTNLTTVDLSEFNLSKVSSSSNMFSNMTNFDTLITPKVNSNNSISIGKTLINQNNSTTSYLYSSTPTKITLKVPYIITYDLNGGESITLTCKTSKTTKQLYPGNPLGTIPISSATKFGYAQNGWCTDVECNSVIDLNENTIPPSSITYYVHWTKDGVWADNVSYSHSGINCSDTQCMLEYLANNYKVKRVSVNGN